MFHKILLGRDEEIQWKCLPEKRNFQESDSRRDPNAEKVRIGAKRKKKKKRKRTSRGLNEKLIRVHLGQTQGSAL